MPKGKIKTGQGTDTLRPLRPGGGIMPGKFGTNMGVGAALIATIMLAYLIQGASTGGKTCPYDGDYKYAVNKALITFIQDPADSQMSEEEIKEMLDFYFGEQNITNADCSEGNISALIDKADDEIPDSVMGMLATTMPKPADNDGGNGNGKCDACEDGAVCGQKNDKNQTCTCQDIDSDNRSEFCTLKPISPPKSSCSNCPDKTACGEQNIKEQICRCRDVNHDGNYEYCELKT